VTGRPEGDAGKAQPGYDELAAKQFERDARMAAAFRQEVFSRDPESAVDPLEAAAVLGITAEQLQNMINEGELALSRVCGEQIIRVADLREAFDEQTRRLQEFAKDWTQLRAQLDWDE
jgi:hypothetical protein